MVKKNKKPVFKREPVKDIGELTQIQINKLTEEQLEQYIPYPDDIVAKTKLYGIEIPFSIMQHIYINMNFFKKTRKQIKENAFKAMISSSAYFRNTKASVLEEKFQYLLKKSQKITKKDKIKIIEQEIEKAVKTYIKTRKHKRILEY